MLYGPWVLVNSSGARWFCCCCYLPYFVFCLAGNQASWLDHKPVSCCVGSDSKGCSVSQAFTMLCCLGPGPYVCATQGLVQDFAGAGWVVEIVVQLSKPLLLFGVCHMHDSKVNWNWKFMDRIWGSPPADCSLGLPHALALREPMLLVLCSEDEVLWASAAWAAAAQLCDQSRPPVRMTTNRQQEKRGSEEDAPPHCCLPSLDPSTWPTCSCLLFTVWVFVCMACTSSVFRCNPWQRGCSGGLFLLTI